MSNPNNREGTTRKTLQGLTARVIRYYNRDEVKVLIVETNEVFITDWKTFNKGLVRGDLSKLHTHTDCTFGQAKFVITSMSILILAFIGILIYFLIR